MCERERKRERERENEREREKEKEGERNVPAATGGGADIVAVAPH